MVIFYRTFIKEEERLKNERRGLEPPVEIYESVIIILIKIIEKQI